MSLITEMVNFKKGYRNAYFPKPGETYLFSGPHCDDENGFVYVLVEVLWTDDTFIITRTPNCWPTVDKWEHIQCKPIEDEIKKMKELNYEKLKELVSKLPDGEYWYDGEEGIRTEKGSSLNPFVITYRPEIGNAYAMLNKELLMELIEKAQKHDILDWIGELECNDPKDYHRGSYKTYDNCVGEWERYISEAQTKLWELTNS